MKLGFLTQDIRNFKIEILKAKENHDNNITYIKAINKRWKKTMNDLKDFLLIMFKCGSLNVMDKYGSELKELLTDDLLRWMNWKGCAELIK
jgi:hypothetical protein